MKPLNYKERRDSALRFILVFGIMMILMFFTGFITIKTGEKGVSILEDMHMQYVTSYRKKASLSYETEEIIKRLYEINNKNRNLSQHKKFQDLITEALDKISSSIDEEEEGNESYIVYKEMVILIKSIQGNLDTYGEKNEKYIYLEELLERCKTKYIEDQKKNKK